MPAAARSAGQDRVFSRTGVGRGCGSPMQTFTGEGSPDVLINGVGAVCQGDRVAVHPRAGCNTDISVLTSFSSTVFVNGKGVGRIGDEYTSDNIIISGSRNVFIGG